MTDREREALDLALRSSARSAAVADLTDKVGALNTEVGALTGEVRTVAAGQAEERVWRRRFIAAFAGFALMSCLLIVVALQNYDNGRVVRDTIDPGGERYQRNQRSQAAVIDRLVTDDELNAAKREITDCLLGRGPCP